MKAAVVKEFGRGPIYGEFEEPVAGEGETVVSVRAAALSPIVRALASGRHYASGAKAGFVAGMDGVGIDGQGRRLYFLFAKPPFGSMAERSLVPTSMTILLPDGIPDDRAAAIVTGGLASWIALTRRAQLNAGGTVLINGATGAAGGMAVQVARYLGAGRVVAVGRNRARLGSLDADASIVLDEGADPALRSEFDHGVDVILDFLWGDPASRVIAAATHDRGSRKGEPLLRYVQIGTSAGAEIPLRGESLRSTGLELVGSGIGAVSAPDLLAGAGELIGAMAKAGFDAPFQTVPLTDISKAWRGDPAIRYILAPTASTHAAA